MLHVGTNRSALLISASNSMSELSCRETVPNNSRSHLARGGIDCVPLVIGSHVGVGLERGTEHRATDPPC